MSALALPVRIRRALAALVLALLVLAAPLVPVGAVWAHAQLVSSDPADGAVLDRAPEEIELVFNERVDVVVDGVRLLAADGDPRVLTAGSDDAVVTAVLPEGLPDGSYAVSYRVVSADGHPVTGAVTFQLGAGGPAEVEVPEGESAAATATVRILTGVHLLGALLFAGLLLFERGVRRGSGAPDRWTRRLLTLTCSAAVLGAGLLPPAAAARITGAGIETWFAALPPDQLVVAGATSVAGLGGLWLVLRRPRWVAPQVVAAAVAVLAPVVVGHSRSTSPVGLMLAADGVHLFAAAFWLGGVVALVHALAAPNPSETRTDRRTATNAVVLVERFSAIAIVVVALLGLAGVLMSLVLLDTPGDLLTTGYGRTLAVKLGLVAVVIAVAAWNRRYLRRLVAGPDRSGPSALHRAMRYEAALLITVVALTAVLTTMSPGHQHSTATPATQSVSETSQGLQLTGTVDPAQVGSNTLTFQLRFEEDAVTENVQVRYGLSEADLGPLDAPAEFDSATGQWSVDLLCAAAGTWQVAVSARMSAFAEPIVVLEVPVQ